MDIQYKETMITRKIEAKKEKKIKRNKKDKESKTYYI